MIRKLIISVFLALFLVAVSAQSEFKSQLADSALTLTKQKVVYDPSYYSIPYPNGDVPAGRGVCTDVIIRAYRKLGVDLQRLVHEDMKANFALYPTIWGLKKPDKNIDHRRVPNLMTYFSRFGKVLPVTNNSVNYKPGEIVCWELSSGVSHIGIVINKKLPGTNRHYVVHNIGAGQVMEDCLFQYKIIGHYSFEK